MATALAQQIQCSVCLCEFTDPVSLPCEHLFCRQCILLHLQNCSRQFREAQCPDCRRSFRQEDIQAIRPLKNIVDSVKEHLSELRFQQSSGKEQGSSCMLCPAHDEKLKLFCETDQTLICLVCRDAQQHRCHNFIAASDAASIRQVRVKAATERVSKDNKMVDELIQCQLSEISKIKELSTTLSAQIATRFDEMHEFLRKKEHEEKKRLESEADHALMKINRNLMKMERLLSNGIDNEVILKSALEADQPDRFLQWWCENGNRTIMQVEQDHVGTARSPIKSLMKDIKMTNESLFHGSLETALQVNVAREMMRAMTKIPEEKPLYEEGSYSSRLL